ncbi:MAG TPA: VWA domain-containing protein [Myxococcota bacterium]|jgi:Ca-activated chloride channel family protein
MQRTAVIYGLALSTLVGAFFLAPRLKPAPQPDPVPVPVPAIAPPSSLSPITDLVYSDGVLEAHAQLDRGYLLSGADEAVWVDLSLKANGVQTRAPLTAVLVIDRSGSMAGDKIDAARQAGERYVRGLRDGDSVGIITFGTDVTTELPITTIDDKTRKHALSVVKNIDEGGGTNIDGALTSARQMLNQADLLGRVGRVVLVTDGRPTEGDRREATLVGHAQRFREKGIATSTLGLGLDYNEDLLEKMAVEGGGRYHYLKTPEQLARILDDELQQATAVVAADVKLYLPRDLGNGLSVVDAPGQHFTSGDRVAVDVGDLAAGEERHVLIKLQPSGSVTGPVQFLAPEIVYKKVLDRSDALLAHRADPFRLLPTGDSAQLEQSRNDAVRVRVLQNEASLALDASMNSYARGDAKGARVQLEEKKAELHAFAAKTKSASLAAEAKNIDDVISSVAAAPAASSDRAQDIIKAQKARAFELRR